MLPVCGILDRRRGDELLPALQDADGVVRLHRAVTLLDDDELLVEKARLDVVEALGSEPGEEHHVLGRGELLDDLGDAALPGPALGEDDGRERIGELAGDGDEVQQALVRVLADEAQGVDVAARPGRGDPGA